MHDFHFLCEIYPKTLKAILLIQFNSKCGKGYVLLIYLKKSPSGTNVLVIAHFEVDSLTPIFGLKIGQIIKKVEISYSYFFS